MKVVEKIGDGLLKRADADLEGIKKGVQGILDDVQKGGDSALRKYTQKFDGVEPAGIEVGRKDVRASVKRIPKDILDSLRFAAGSIRSFAEVQMPKADYMGKKGIELGTKVIPLRRVGCYVPGGRAFYPSTVLMGVVPAKVAGVEEVIVCTPPNSDGKVNDVTLAACEIAGADRVFAVGGVQAIGAMAYGTETVPKVDKIVGPGNVYVSAAKGMVPVGIDFFAGPSEVLIIADNSANPDFIACDLLAQAEHGPDSAAVLVTPDRNLAERVGRRVDELVRESPRRDMLEKSLERYSYILIVKSIDDAVKFANRYAPEHLEIVCRKDILGRIRNAGSIFVGEYSPVAAGDYCSGTNHILPTGGGAKFCSGVSVDMFLKKVTWQKVSKEGLNRIGRAIVTLADAEGLPEHARSVWERLK
ncbi:MAG: histidinol dehydrogenase [archaeon]